MKTQIRILRWLMLLVLLIGASGAWAQVGGLTQTGNMNVCLNSAEQYGVMPTAGSTYTWSIIAGSGGAGTITNGAAPNNLISVNWTSSGTCTLQVLETNSTCTGIPVNIQITVFPTLTPGSATADQTICYSTAPALLTATAPAGGSGTYTYQWESSIDGGTTWSPIGGANTLTYQPPILTQTTLYHLLQISGGGNSGVSCGTVITNIITITVQPQLVAGVATADQTICYNGTPAPISSTVPVGGNGTYTYQWESSINGGTTWVPVAGATNLTYAPGVLTQTTLYHLIQTSGAGCGIVTTNDVTISVQPQLVAGTATANQTICYNGTPAPISSTLPVGGNGTYTYQWESSTNGGTTWVPEAGATNLTYAPGILTLTTMYHLIQTSGAGCGTATTNAVTITVQPQLVAGIASADQTICYNGTPAPLSSTVPIGGNGAYTYQWESSINGGTTWVPESGATNLTYAPGVLTQTTLYHLIQTSGAGCGSVTTNIITITIQPQLVAGIATDDQTICNSGTPVPILSTVPVGGNGTYTYQWESSIDGGTTWVPIAGATNLTYAPGVLTQTTLYHLVQTSGAGCGSVTTNNVTISVQPQLVAGTATADQTICYNTVPTPIASTLPVGGNGTYTYQWESSTNGGTTWVPEAGATNLTYAPGILTLTTMYHLIQTSGAGCGSQTTNAVTITVQPQLVAGTATADQTICYNSTPAPISSTVPVGGNGTYTYQWESSIDGGTTWIPVAGATNLTFAPGVLTQTTMYHLIQTSGAGCGSVTTNNVTITVQPQLTAGIATANQSTCYGGTPTPISATAPAGGNGTYTYQWESSIDGGITWIPVATATNLTYAPGALIQTTLFHLIQTSGAGCGSVTTNDVTITILPQLVTSPIYHN